MQEKYADIVTLGELTGVDEDYLHDLTMVGKIPFLSESEGGTTRVKDWIFSPSSVIEALSIEARSCQAEALEGETMCRQMNKQGIQPK